MMDGYLQTRWLKVQRKRIRESIERTSPFPVAYRLSKTVQIRQYSVPMSDSLWHIDGHMKIIRWGISTHGGIDGYSRLITFLKADADNRAATVLNHFIGACVPYGIPSRARSDHGGENIMIALFMNLVNGEYRNSHLTGRSVHNQRIERLSRDVFVQVITKYYDLFYAMEDEGLLDPTNPVHISALHIVYIPLICKDLEVFRNAWNSHKLSTENNLTPQQLWMTEVLNNINSDHQPVRNMYGEDLCDHLNNRLEMYGLDPADFRDQSIAEERLLTADQHEVLLARITQLEPKEAFGKCLDYFTEIGLV